MIDIHLLAEAAGIITIIVSAVGMIFALKHTVFFHQTRNKLAQKVQAVFLTDAMIYAVTLFFGVWAFFEMSFQTAIWLQWLRIPIILLNIYASYRLYKHYKSIK